MRSMKVGVIGCGKQAPKHIGGLKKNKDVDIVVADIIPDIAKELARQTEVDFVESPDEIFTDNGIIAVDICTPTSFHAPLIHQAISFNKHFLCEKPLCSSLQEAEELDRLINGSNCIGMVGYIYRFHPVFEEGKNLFTNGSNILGQPIYASMRLGGRGSHKLWKHQKEKDGGVMNEMLVHMIDLAIWYFGAVKDVEILACDLLLSERVIDGKKYQVDAEDFIVVRLKMESGITVLCQSDMVTPSFTQFIEVQGENGTFMGSIQPDMPSFVFCKQPKENYDAGKNKLNFGSINLFETQMEIFVNAVKEGKTPDRCTVKDSVLLLKALEQIKEKVEKL